VHLNASIDQFSTGNNFLKTERLANGVSKMTLENGIQIYKIPQDLMPPSPSQSPLGCGSLPASANGCCCINFVGFYDFFNIPGSSFVIKNSFIFSEKEFVIPDPADRVIYLKIEKPDIDLVFFDQMLYWADNSPNCNYSSFAVIFPVFPLCQGNIQVTAQKLYKLPNEPFFNVCAETVSSFFYLPTPSPVCSD
jgi:hypothetical protein